MRLGPFFATGLWVFWWNFVGALVEFCRGVGVHHRLDGLCGLAGSLVVKSVEIHHQSRGICGFAGSPVVNFTTGRPGTPHKWSLDG